MAKKDVGLPEPADGKSHQIAQGDEAVLSLFKNRRYVRFQEIPFAALAYAASSVSFSLSVNSLNNAPPSLVLVIGSCLALAVRYFRVVDDPRQIGGRICIGQGFIQRDCAFTVKAEKILFESL